jgi:hypothetical protein
MTDTLWPAAIEKGLTCAVMTPEGIPLKTTCTLPLNPFNPETLTVSGAL